MKTKKNFFVGCAAALILTATSVTAFAAAYQTPAEAAAGITGKTQEEVVSERQSGKSYGAVAAESGKLKEFQEAVLEIRKDTLAERVEDGTLTQEKADALLEAMADRQASCDGTGTGAGCGLGGMGYGRGNGRGNGNGLRDGSCYTK